MHQTTSVEYIFENVLLLNDIWTNILKSYQYINLLFDPPILIDAATLDFYVHWPCFIDTNLLLSHVLIKVLSRIQKSLEFHVDDIWDDNWISLVISKVDEHLPILVKKMEAPYGTFPIFVIFLKSFVFWVHGSYMI